MGTNKIYTLEVEERQLVTYQVSAQSLDEAKEQIEAGFGTQIDAEDAFIPEGASMETVEVEE